jgi:hypothetical protein
MFQFWLSITLLDFIFSINLIPNTSKEVCVRLSKSKWVKYLKCTSVPSSKTVSNPSLSRFLNSSLNTCRKSLVIGDAAVMLRQSSINWLLILFTSNVLLFICHLFSSFRNTVPLIPKLNFMSSNFQLRSEYLLTLLYQFY